MIQGSANIKRLIQKYNMVDPFVEKQLGCVSVDLRLGYELKIYISRLDLKIAPKFMTIRLDSDGYWLKSGDFAIAATFEKVNIPNGYWGFIETKGNIARAGLSVHNADGHIDPGFMGNVTLEVKNQNTYPVKIYPNMLFAQLFLFKIDGESIMYKGKYQKSIGPTIFRPDKDDKSNMWGKK